MCAKRNGRGSVVSGVFSVFLNTIHTVHIWLHVGKIYAYRFSSTLAFNCASFSEAS